MNSNTIPMNIPVDQIDGVLAYLRSLNVSCASTEMRVGVEESKEELYNADTETDDDTEYVVKHISDFRINTSGEYEYLTHFAGYKDPEWIPENLCSCEGLISKFLSTRNINTVYCYSRVSTKNQSGENHVSLSAQEYELKTTASTMFPRHRVKIYQTIHSAYTKNIPSNLQDICRYSRSNDVLLIYRVDRFARNVTIYSNILEELANKGVIIHSCLENINYDNPRDRLKFIELIVQAERESQHTSERILSSLGERKRRGDEWFGGPVKYGKSKIRLETGKVILVDNQEEQAILERIATSINYFSTKSLAKILADEGITKRGKPWTKLNIKTVWDDRGLKWKRPIKLREIKTKRVGRMMDVRMRDDNERYDLRSRSSSGTRYSGDAEM